MMVCAFPLLYIASPRQRHVPSLVTVSKIIYSRTTGVETWITSDGRVYFVGLHETAPESSVSEFTQSDDQERVSPRLILVLRLRLTFARRPINSCQTPSQAVRSWAGKAPAFTTLNHRGGCRSDGGSNPERRHRQAGSRTRSPDARCRSR